MKYFAHIIKESHKMYFVEFPELEGCVTEGITLKEARHNASEALHGWLTVRCDHKLHIPLPKLRRSKKYHPIEVNPQLALAIMLRNARKLKGFSQKQVAKKNGYFSTGLFSIGSSKNKSFVYHLDKAFTNTEYSAFLTLK